MKSSIVLALVLLAATCFIGCSKPKPAPESFTPPYDINVQLMPVAVKASESHGSGHIKFRQDPDTARIISLETWVSGLAPQHAYILQRAVNPITDPGCTSAAWLTLGKGLVAQSINTDAAGNGHENLWRDITTIARGTQFRIHFQIVDAVTQVLVLMSDCDVYEVR